MGNCLAGEVKLIKIAKIDGKIIEYGPPMRVRDVLVDFPGHAISETLPVYRFLPLDNELLSENLYHLVPLPAGDKNHVPDPATVTEKGNGVIRIKVVVTKKKLQEMLTEGVSMEEMISRLQDQADKDRGGDCDSTHDKLWRPRLESIPEGCDFI